MIIEHLGKTIQTQRFKQLYPNEMKYIRENLHNVDFDAVDFELGNVLLHGKRIIGNIYIYYFEKLAYDTVIHTTRWSINQILENDYLLSLFIGIIYDKPKVFNNNDLIANFKDSTRIAGKGIAGKPTNFPLGVCIDMLKKYKLNTTESSVYIDTSCGWGVRMLASAICNMDYIGFDVNTKLIEQLKLFGKHIQKFKPDWNFKIIEHGSEVYVPELENKANIMFTSPPYFDLEVYSNDDAQSVHLFNDYDSWCNGFLKPTLANSYAYAMDGSYVLINIKDFKNYDLGNKTVQYAKNVGFSVYPPDRLLNLSARYSQSKTNRIKLDNSKPIFVFAKEINTKAQPISGLVHF